MKIVLVTPEIPFNTGSIGRTCVALDLELILIKPYGFSLDTKAVSRSGTRYWKDVQLSEYDNWNHFLTQRSPTVDSLYFFEENGSKSFYKPNYKKDDYLVFGCESVGLPKDLLVGVKERIFHIPMTNPAVKSLNLANAVTAVVYQAMRTQFSVAK